MPAMRLSRQGGATRLELTLSITIAIAVLGIIGYLISAERDSAAETRYYVSAYVSAMKHAGQLGEKLRLTELKLTDRELPHHICAPPLKEIWVRSTTGKMVPGCRQVAPAPAAAPAQEPGK